MKKKCSTVFMLFLIIATAVGSEQSEKIKIIFSGSTTNDLYKVLEKEGYEIELFGSASAAISVAPEGSPVFITAGFYPKEKTKISSEVFKEARRKRLKLYIEYPESLPGFDIPKQPINTRLERGVITSKVFGQDLKPMSILGINDAYVLPLEVSNPLIVLAKVAGFDKAEYGIDDVKTYPLLFQRENMLIATTKLTNFATGRYGPDDAWRQMWTHILSWMTGDENITIEHWPSYVAPMFGKDEVLPKTARKNSIRKGVEWFSNGRFYIHPEWKDMWLRYQGDGTNPTGPPIADSLPTGDGSLGLLEGHASNIYHDGSQQYRYWIRADVQGEAAFALAAAGNFLNKEEYYKKAFNLIDFALANSNLRSGPRNEKSSPTYGLVGWSVTHPGVYYGDDNARLILGVLGASAFMNVDKWNEHMVEAIMANFRTTGENGFRGNRLSEEDIQKNGWKHYWEREIINPAPHFESWMWACYLWLYDKTGYKPLFEKTKKAIRMTMDAYPDEWLWTNGIQQERARMVLPLAWLVRIEDTEEHRKWLDEIVSELLKNQVESGAIREELGAGDGRYGRTSSNKEYGLHEAPLIFKNGDPVADMLYTNNFAFFSLKEAADATGKKEYQNAVNKLSDFLTRIQVKSEKHEDLDGAWFRAFEFDRWEYWASNADAGWGAWGTLTGWTQSWIVATQVLTAQNQSFWDLTRGLQLENYMEDSVDLMFEEK